jgi:hypothetical protein
MTKISRKPYNNKTNIHKMLTNKTIMDLGKLYIKKRKFHSLIMDGTAMNTTRHLRQIFKTRTIITSIEKEPDIHQKHLQNGIWSFNNIHYDVIARKSRTKFAIIYFDFCGTIKNHGNIHHMFENKFMDDVCVFAVTFCRRSTIKGTIFDVEYKNWKRTFVDAGIDENYELIAKPMEYKYKNNGSMMQTDYFVFEKR